MEIELKDENVKYSAESFALSAFLFTFASENKFFHAMSTSVIQQRHVHSIQSFHLGWNVYGS